MFNDFEPWQWELAFVASRFRLGVLTDDEIIAFTHKLMDNGFYDDVMLDIIEYDPVFDYSNQFNHIKTHFENLWLALHFPQVTIEQAKYLFTFNILFSYTIRPFNLNGFDWNLIDFIIYNHEDEIERLTDYNEIYELCRVYEDMLDKVGWGEVYNGYNDLISIQKTTENLYQECETWLNRNQSKILAIMHQLFP